MDRSTQDMEIIEKGLSSSCSTRKDDLFLERVEVVEKEEEEDVALPGFRFHPTDEELVGFYLRRKVQKKPISLELIKQIDIYKHDPWDLPKASNVGDKEWYFFCKRGRKYRNSIRPNRVTGSGFWKATGIDRRIYSANGSSDCIGLKKSLVYYRGSAGKGTKTDWMMHEFRLPPSNEHDKTNNKHNVNFMDDKTIAQEAEVWTLCRILKRGLSTQRKCIPDWREMAAAKRDATQAFDHEASSKTCSADSDNYYLHQSTNYISFVQGPVGIQEIEKKPFSDHDQYRYDHHNHHVMTMNKIDGKTTTMNDNHLQALQYNFTGHLDHPWSSMSSPHQDPSTASCSSFSHNIDVNEFIKHGNWDELRSVVEFAAGDPTFYM